MTRLRMQSQDEGSAFDRFETELSLWNPRDTAGKIIFPRCHDEVVSRVDQSGGEHDAFQIAEIAKVLRKVGPRF